MNKLKHVLFAAALLVTAVCHGQKSIPYEEITARYKDDPAIFLNRSEQVNIQVSGDSLLITTENFEQVLHLKDQAEAFSSGRVHGSHFEEVSDIKAKTMVWEKNRYRDFIVSNFQRKSDTDDAVFYDDSYYYAFTYPSLGARNITQLEYKSTYKDVRFVPGFIFSSYLPQQKVTYKIKTSKSVNIVYEVINDPEKNIQFTKTSKGNDTVYEWTWENVPEFKIESNSPSIRYYVPHVIVYVSDYTTATGKKKSVLSGLDDLYKWYYSFVDGLNSKPSDDLVRIVDDLKAKGGNEAEVVRSIFYWVQNNIRYIAFEDGMRGFIPHNGSYVCEKRYGDCKDMANLLVTMINLAGYKAYHTWIGTRDLPYTYTKVPTPMVDNHMIATYISPEGKYIFLDATSNHTAFGLPSSMIQGKEALIALSSDKYEIRRVPEIDKEKNLMTDSVFVSIKNNELVGTGYASVTGYPKVNAGYRLDRSKEEDVKNYVTRLVGKGSNKFYLDNYKIANLDNNDAATRIDYDFRIGDYFQKISDEIYLNLNLNKDYYNEYISLDNRETPWENDYRYTKTEVCVLSIPDGYTVDYLPENTLYKGKDLGLHVEYVTNQDKVIMKKTFYLDFLMLEPGQFTGYNESVKSISEAYKESIILKKKN